MNISIIRRLLSAGVRDEPREAGTAEAQSCDRWVAMDRGALDSEMVVVLPTRPSRQSTPELLQKIGILAGQAVVAEQAEGCRVGIVAILQYADDVERELAQGICEAVDEVDDHVTAMVTSEVGKIAALNTVFALLAPSVRFVGWVDDDVQLGAGALTELLRAIESMPAPASVGATKVPNRTGHRTSHALARAKTLMPSAMNYPHGCAMVVTADVVRDGIPPKYASDDGWVCFQLLDPAVPDVFGRMRLVPDAEVSYLVGGSLESSLRRLRRQRIGQLLLLADAPGAVGSCYLRKCALHGVSLTPWDASAGKFSSQQAERAIYSWIHVVSTLMLAGELVLRGLFRYPLDSVGWGSPVAMDRVDPGNSQKDL